MKYALVFLADQTIVFAADARGRTTTTKHPEAYLYESRADAEKVREEHEARTRAHWENNGWKYPDEGTVWVDEVEDEVEFRSREDTW